MANRNLSCVILLGGLSVNLNHLKTRNGRKLVPENKMPNLHWNLEKQETVYKKEIQEIRTTTGISRMQKVIIHMIIFIYKYIIQLQDSFPKYAKSAIRATQTAVGTTRDISRSSWTKAREEMQTLRELLRAQLENSRNQSFGSHNSHNDCSPTQ